MAIKLYKNYIFIKVKARNMTKTVKTASTPPNTGSILRSYVRKKRIYQAALARHLGKSSQTIAKYQKKASIQTKTLWELSTALQHNFFMDIAQMLPDTFSTENDIFEERDKRIAALEEEVKTLKIEKAVLLESKK